MVNLKRVGIETAMMTRYDNFDSTLNSRTMNCACCGKEFLAIKDCILIKNDQQAA